MNLNYKKSAKILLLLLSSILIASVSAQVYRYMYIDGSVTVGAAKMVWIKGTGAPSDSAVSGSTYTVDLDVEPGTPLNFTDCVYLKNQDTASHDMNISVSTTISATDFTECKMHIYENTTTPGTWTFVDTLDITTSDSINNSLSLGNGEYYKMEFEVSPTLSATGTYDFGLEVQYE
jgi:hypothetical protein